MAAMRQPCGGLIIPINGTMMGALADHLLGLSSGTEDRDRERTR